jgi:hypothetical protein
MKIVKIKVKHRTLDTLNAILATERPDLETGIDDIIQTFTANFGNGIEADIKVCNGDGPYIDPVLFEDGNEVVVGEPSWILDGVYDFEYMNEIYRVVIEGKRK